MNQMEIFKTRSLAVSGSSKKTANTCSAERMWPLRWGTAIPAMQLSAIVGMS